MGCLLPGVAGPLCGTVGACYYGRSGLRELFLSGDSRTCHSEIMDEV